MTSASALFSLGRQLTYFSGESFLFPHVGCYLALFLGRQLTYFWRSFWLSNALDTSTNALLLSSMSRAASEAIAMK